MINYEVISGKLNAHPAIYETLDIAANVKTSGIIESRSTTNSCYIISIYANPKTPQQNDSKSVKNPHVNIDYFKDIDCS